MLQPAPCRVPRGSTDRGIFSIHWGLRCLMSMLELVALTPTREAGALVYAPSATLRVARTGETLRFVDPQGTKHLFDIVTAQTLESGNRLIRAERGSDSILAIVTESGDYTATVQLGEDALSGEHHQR